MCHKITHYKYCACDLNVAGCEKDMGIRMTQNQIQKVKKESGSKIEDEVKTQTGTGQSKANRMGKYFPHIALLVSMAGFALFYLIPFVTSSVYAFTDNPVRMKFVGLKNFADIFKNQFFIRGLSNTVLFLIIAIPLSIVLSLLLAIGLKELPRAGEILSVLFLIPMVVPSASAVWFWIRIFAENGVVNQVLKFMGICGVNWFDGNGARAVCVVIFVWKNLGYNAILFLAGLHSIPEEYYQCASVFGAGAWQRFRQITLVYLTPTFFLTFLMSFVNGFKIYREVFLIWHDYPPESVYLLQHFVNNTLLSLHYEKLVSAVYVLTGGMVLIVALLYGREKRSAASLHM